MKGILPLIIPLKTAKKPLLPPYISTNSTCPDSVHFLSIKMFFPFMKVNKCDENPFIYFAERIVYNAGKP